jgi:hypothetical protein
MAAEVSELIEDKAEDLSSKKEDELVRVKQK